MFVDWFCGSFIYRGKPNFGGAYWLYASRLREWWCVTGVAGLDMGVGGMTALHGTQKNGGPSIIGMTLSYRTFNTRNVAMRPHPSRQRVHHDSICRLHPLLAARFGVRKCPSPRFISLILGIGPRRMALIPSTPSRVASGTK